MDKNDCWGQMIFLDFIRNHYSFTEYWTLPKKSHSTHGLREAIKKTQPNAKLWFS